MVAKFGDYFTAYGAVCFREFGDRVDNYPGTKSLLKVYSLCICVLTVSADGIQATERVYYFLFSRYVMLSWIQPVAEDG
jgi:beta-glucosidase/6-phospho-beta-glucosidase/beta-galactosidase